MITDPVAKLLLQRLLLLMVRVRTCNEVCIKPSDFCDTHENDWKRLERDVKRALGPGAN